MRIDAWRVGAFGPLAEWDVNELGGQRVVVVLGDNEAGKSTLFEFLTTMLFGFSPARADAHPYDPWKGGVLGGSLDVALEDAPARVARTLRSRPEGRLTSDGRSQDLANRPVPWVGSLNKEIFRSIHALTQEEALGLKPDAWQEVQERILGGTSYEFLIPASVAIAGLEEEAGRLWRPTKRGNQRDKDLQERLSGLRGERREARDRQDRLFEIDREVDDLGRRIVLLREGSDESGGLKQIDLALERANALHPIYRQVERIHELRNRSAELLPDDDLPPDSAARLDELTAAIEVARGQVEDLTTESQRLDDALTVDDESERLAEQEEQIERLHSEVGAHREDLNRVAAMDRHIRQWEGRVEERATDLLDEAPAPSVQEGVAGIRLAELRGRVIKWEQDNAAASDARLAVARAGQQVDRMKTRLDESAPDSSLDEVEERIAALRRIDRDEAFLRGAEISIGASPAAWIFRRAGAAVLILALAAGALGAVDVAALRAIMFVVAGVAAIAGIFAVYVANSIARRQPPEPVTRTRRDVIANRERSGVTPEASLEPAIRNAEQQLEELRQVVDLRRRLTEAQEEISELSDQTGDLEAAEEESRRRAHQVLAGVPIADVRLEQPGRDLLVDIQELHNAIVQVNDTSEDREEVHERIDERVEGIGRLAEAVGWRMTDDPLDIPLRAFRNLPDARAKVTEATKAKTALPNTRAELKQAEDDLETATDHHESLVKRLRALDPNGGSIEAGMERVLEARNCLTRAAGQEEDLERDTPDWQHKFSEAASLVEDDVRLELSSEERSDLRRRHSDLQGEVEGLMGQQGQLIHEREQLHTEPGLGYYDGAIDAVQEEQAEIRQERDRLVLLTSVIREAERRFRERYQPPILEAATEHLNRITDGRYDLLLVEETSGQGVPLLIRRAGEEIPRRVDHPLSRGIRQQVYLALRLALIEHMESGEPLPLFLDEMLVNWDPKRTEAGIDVLGRLGEERQIFMFTCDPRLARDVEDHLGTQAVEMPAMSDIP